MAYHAGMIAHKYRNLKCNFYLVVSGPAKDGASLWKLQRSFDLLRSLRMTMDSAALTTSSSSDGQKSGGRVARMAKKTASAPSHTRDPGARF